MVLQPLWMKPMKPMSKQDRELFVELLTEQKKVLLKEGDRAASGMTDDVKENFPDPTDRASLESNRSFMLRIKDRERRLATKIDDALKRIEDGEYGTCEECGEPIGVERLKARPVTTLCIDCKAAQEDQEKQIRA